MDVHARPRYFRQFRNLLIEGSILLSYLYLSGSKLEDDTLTLALSSEPTLTTM